MEEVQRGQEGSEECGVQGVRNVGYREWGYLEESEEFRVQGGQKNVGCRTGFRNWVA